MCCSQGVKKFTWLKSVCSQRKAVGLCPGVSVPGDGEVWKWGAHPHCIQESPLPSLPGAPSALRAAQWELFGEVWQLASCLWLLQQEENPSNPISTHMPTAKNTLSPTSIVLWIIVASGPLAWTDPWPASQDTNIQRTHLIPGNSDELPRNAPEIFRSSPKFPDSWNRGSILAAL